MTNELTQDAEESRAIEKTAIKQSESTTAAAEAVAPTTTETTAPATATQQAPDLATEPVPDPVETAPAPVETAPEPVQATPSEDTLATETTAPETPTEQTPEVAAEPVPVPVETAPEPVQTAPTADASADEAPAASGEIDFGAILEQFEQEQTVFHQGELVEGKVVGITDRGVLVDFGYKSEGFVPVEEFTGPDGQMMATVGETVEVIIRTILSGDGAPQLSRVDALGRKVWDEIEAAFNAEQPVTGRVVDKTKGGLRIDLNGIEAFLPGSQIDSRPIRSLDSYIGQDIEAQIMMGLQDRGAM